MAHLLRILSPLVLLYSCLPVGAGTVEVKDIVCPSAGRALTVDGRIEAEEWTGAARFDRFFTLRSGAAAPAPTTVYVMSDASRFCIGAQLHFRSGHAVKASCDTDQDGEIWRDDCLEVFIDADLRTPGAVQLIVNARGRLLAQLLGTPEAPGDGWRLTPRPEIGASVTDGVLSLEVAVTFAALGVPKPERGDVWGLKVCRTHWDRTPTTDRSRPGDVYTASVPGAGMYASRPYASLIFAARTDRTARLLKETGASDRQKAHPYHGLESARRTNVWAKPGLKLARDGISFGERLIFRDTGTGAEIWRVTFNPHEDGASYANVFPWNADGSLLMFTGRQRVNGYWNMLMSADGTRIWRPAGYAKMTHPRWTRDLPEYVLCSRGRELFHINVLNGDEARIASLPEDVRGSVSFGPEGVYAAACKQGFGAGAELTLIELATGQARRLPLRTSSEDFNGDWLYSGNVSYIGDTPHIGYSLNHLPHLSAEHKYQQWVMNLVTGDYRQVKYLSHGGTSPNRDRKVGFSGGAIYTTDWFGDDKRFVMQIGTGGHMPWMSSPSWCVAGTSGAPNSTAFANQLVQVFVDNGNWCRIAHGQTANTSYASHLFANTSPDGTKVEYSSTMLGPRDMYWAVMARPEPPLDVRVVRAQQGVELSWSTPVRAKEIRGYRVWRAAESGGPYELVSGRDPVGSTTWRDTGLARDRCAFYALTSVEHSTLESRRFSTEVAVPVSGQQGWPGKVRRYIEAESGEASNPMAEDFSGTASCDRFVSHRHGEGDGVLRVSAELPRSGRYQLWIRGRGTGRLVAELGGQRVGEIELDTAFWSWFRVPSSVELAATTAELALRSQSTGVGLDKLLITDDFALAPSGLGDVPPRPPLAPRGLAVSAATSFDISLAWTAPDVPDVHHYQVYRGRSAGFAPAQAHLVGSPSEPWFCDWGLAFDAEYHYCLTAVDTWGTESVAARVSARTEPLATRVLLEIEPEQGRAENGRYQAEPDPAAAGGSYIVLPAEVVTETPFRLVLPVDVPVAGAYAVWLSLCPMVDPHVYLTVDIDGRTPSLMYLQNSQEGATAQRFMWRPVGAVNGPTPVLWELDRGKRELRVSLVGRPGFAQRVTAIDRVIVTNDLAFVPAGRIWDWE